MMIQVMQLVTNGGRLEPPNYCPGPLYGLMCQVDYHNYRHCHDFDYFDHHHLMIILAVLAPNSRGTSQLHHNTREAWLLPSGL